MRVTLQHDFKQRFNGAWRATALAAAIVVAFGLALASGHAGAADPRRAAKAAFAREDYVKAAELMIPLAESGDAQSQAYLGFMFEQGRGVPQNYTEATYWYRRASEQGFSTAQYTLGLLYDKGFGVPQDPVEAGKWLTLAAGGAPRESREYYARMRDAVATKLTRGQIAEARRRAIEFAPRPELQRYVRSTVRVEPLSK